MPTSPTPRGYHTVNPYLIVPDADRLIQFLRDVLDAQEVLVMRQADGKVTHASFRVGDSMVELADATEKWQPTQAGLHVYVRDTDEAYQRALQAGGESLFEPEDMFYGERSAGVKDPAGNQWFFATVKEELSLDELHRRAAEWEKKGAES